MKKLILTTAIALFASSASAKEYPVSTTSYNLFEFPEAVEQAIIPDGIDLKDDPRYVDGNKGLLLNFIEGEPPFQLVVTLVDGTTHMIDVVPRKAIEGQRYRIGDFSGEVVRDGGSHHRNPNADYLGVMAEKLANLSNVPKGFLKMSSLPDARMFRGRSDSGDVVGLVLDPVERLQGTIEGRKVYMDLYYLRISGDARATEIDPSQFTEQGVGAITITRDAKDRPYVLIVRQAA